MEVLKHRNLLRRGLLRVRHKLEFTGRFPVGAYLCGTVAYFLGVQ